MHTVAILVLFMFIAGCIEQPPNCASNDIKTPDAKDECYVINATVTAMNGVSFGSVDGICQNIVSNEKKDECYSSVANTYAALGAGYRKDAVDSCEALDGAPGVGQGKINMCLIDIAKKMKDPTICSGVTGVSDIISDFTMSKICADMAEPHKNACATAPLILLMCIVVFMVRS